MKLRHIDFRLTAQIVELISSKFVQHIIDVQSYSLLSYSFVKSNFFPVDIDARIAIVFFFSPG